MSIMPYKQVKFEILFEYKACEIFHNKLSKIYADLFNFIYAGFFIISAKLNIDNIFQFQGNVIILTPKIILAN